MRRNNRNIRDTAFKPMTHVTACHRVIDRCFAFRYGWLNGEASGGNTPMLASDRAGCLLHCCTALLRARAPVPPLCLPPQYTLLTVGHVHAQSMLLKKIIFLFLFFIFNAAGSCAKLLPSCSMSARQALVRLVSDERNNLLPLAENDLAA